MSCGCGGGYQYVYEHRGWNVLAGRRHTALGDLAVLSVIQQKMTLYPSGRVIVAGGVAEE